MIQEKCTCPNYCKNKHHLISCPIYSMLEMLKQKESEMWEEVVQIRKLLKNSDKILKDVGHEVFDSVEVFNFLLKKVVSSIESAARYFITIEERRRLCDEIIDEIKTKKIDMFGWKSCLMHSDDKFINNSYNSGLETAISLIESIKNKI